MSGPAGLTGLETGRAVSWPRDLLAVALVAIAIVLQASLFDHLAVAGVVPDLVLLVVVAAALAHGTEYGLVAGFIGGLLLDLAPPADGVAGRWAFALLVAGYVAGRLRAGQPDLTGRRLTVAAVVAACSFVATSVYALTGPALHDHSVAVPDLLRVVGVAACWDVVLGVLLVPLLVRALLRVAPTR